MADFGSIIVNLGEWQITVDTIINLTGIGVGILVACLIVQSEKNRRKNEQAIYESQTKMYVFEILNHFVEIDRISSSDDIEESEVEINVEDEEFQETVLLHLNRYYKQNQKKMVMLFENAKNSLDKWSGSDAKKNTMYKEIIEDFRWLIEDYFSTSKDEDIQLRMWNNQHKLVSEKRYKIDTTLEILAK